jgi:hypothetical protein
MKKELNFLKVDWVGGNIFKNSDISCIDSDSYELLQEFY